MNAPDATPDRSQSDWLRRAVMIGATVQTLRVARRLRRAADERGIQEATYRRLIDAISRTAFGMREGIRSELPYAEFAGRIVPRTYEQVAPWIERMKAGEADVLWPGRCSYFAVSSGTTQGRTKYLPVTSEMLAHFRHAGMDSLCFYARRAGSARVFGGRHLFLGGATSLTPLPAVDGFEGWAGDLSGITALHLPRWAERHLYEPGFEIAQMNDWRSKLNAMATRTVRRDVRLIAGIPSWVLILIEAVRREMGGADVQDIWPNLECLVHGGVPVGPFSRELRQVLGPQIRFHEVYPASEGFIAAQDESPEAGLRLLTRAGIFYEFLPMAHFDEARLDAAAAHAVPLAGVQPGVDYALLLTTPAGLCRYVIGDIVRFISATPPRLIYVGRTRLQLSAFGEHVIEKEVTDALAAVCARRGVIISNFHVAPLFVNQAEGRSRGRHEWWVELRTPGAAVLDANSAAAELDRELQRINDDYEAKRQGGGLDLPIVRLAPAGTFEAWLRERGRWGGQNKMPRCRSDRQIADELERLCRPPVPGCNSELIR